VTNRLLVLTLALGFLCPSTVLALHRKTAAVVQITPQSGAGDVANPSWAGFRYVIFDSDGDLLGNGNHTRQVFLFDLRRRDLTGDLAIEQLTSGPGNYTRGAAGRRARTAVFEGDGANGHRQIFFVQRNSGVVDALTAGDADSTNPRVDELARVATFESSADFFNTGATGTQVYMVQLRQAEPGCPYPCAPTGNRGLTQITNKNGDSHNAAPAKAGRAIVFESDADLLNSGETSNQVYLLDDLGLLTILSHGPGDSRNPSVSRNARQIAFESDADLLNNGSTGTQIFMRRRLGSPLEQITSAPSGTSAAPAVSSSGRFMTFLSGDDLLANGSTGPEVFTFGVRRGDLSQVTYGPSTIVTGTGHSAGVFATFIADGDLLGNGTSGRALYLVNLFALGNQTVP
jgi:Tol biopolymer transport system component